MTKQHIRMTVHAIVLATLAVATSCTAVAQQPPPMSFFVTSVGLGDGANLGGLEGADAHCQMLAAAVGRGNALWRAYLSTQGENAVNARDRIGTGPWYAYGGQNLDHGWLHGGDPIQQARRSSAIQRMIAPTERGDPVNVMGDSPNPHDILTGSRPDGTAFTGTEDRTCNNWTSNAEGAAQVGHWDAPFAADAAGSTWNSSHPTRGCSADSLASTGGTGLFYCFAVAELPSILQQVQQLDAAAPRRTPTQRKISSILLYAPLDAESISTPAGVRPNEPNQTDEPFLIPADIIIRDGLVTVDIRGEVTPGVLDRIRSLGGEVLTMRPEYSSIRARVPVQELESLAELDAIQTIRPARRVFPRSAPSPQNPHDASNLLGDRNSSTSQGDAAHRADLARRRYNLSGKGIGIGVISDGVDSLEHRQTSGDLPSVTVLLGQARPTEPEPGRVYDEGTAMLEIVHDLAPGAALYFATGYGTLHDFAANIRALCASGAHVIVDDVSRPNEGAFEDGVVAMAIADVVSDGCVYVSAAGNDGNKGKKTSGVWEGDYAPAVGRGELHSFEADGALAAYNRILVDDPKGAICLQWAEPLDEPVSNYDLYLLKPTVDEIMFPTPRRPINGGTSPEQSIECVGPIKRKGSQNYIDLSGHRLLIRKQAGVARFLRLQVSQGRLELSTDGATYGHAAAQGGISVAAVDVGLAAGAAFTGSEVVEHFSSDGPRRIFYEANGTPIAPAGSSLAGPRLRKKPDVAAANRVSTATSSYNPFRGTSAAAPHVAAIAALILEAAGGPSALTPEEVGRVLRDTALDIGAVGAWDRDSGAGIVDALKAVEAVR